MLVVLYGYHLQTGHDGTRWVGPVRGVRDQTDIPVTLADIRQVVTDSNQAVVLPHSTALRLVAESVEFSYAFQIFGEAVNHFHVSLGLVQGTEWMESVELFPG